VGWPAAVLENGELIVSSWSMSADLQLFWNIESYYLQLFLSMESYSQQLFLVG